MSVEADSSTGCVGIPVPCNRIKLVDVPELGYYSKEKVITYVPFHMASHYRPYFYTLSQKFPPIQYNFFGKISSPWFFMSKNFQKRLTFLVADYMCCFQESNYGVRDKEFPRL